MSDELDAGGAGVFRLTGATPLYVKITPVTDHPDPGRSAIAEAQRLEWLRHSDIPVPEVVDSGTEDGFEYLVSTAAPGVPASDPWPRHQRMRVMDALAEFAVKLHAVPVAGCPFDRDLPVTLANARRAVALGMVDARYFDAERQGRDVGDVLAEVEELATALAARPRVLCHGDYCLPNVLLDPETVTVTAMIDVGRLGAADRCWDLALATRSVSHPAMNRQYELRHAQRFLESYGADREDVARLKLYRALDEFS